MSEAYSGIVRAVKGNFNTNINNPKDGDIIEYDGENKEWVNVRKIFRVINETPLGDLVITQDDIDNYGYDDNGNRLILGETYSVSEFDINYREFKELEDKCIFKTKFIWESDKVYNYYETLLESVVYEDEYGYWIWWDYYGWYEFYLVSKSENINLRWYRKKY